MATTITGKLNKPANEFQAGESTGFGIRIGVKYYDRQTKDNQWTNYSAVIFAKAPAQIDFYRQALVENSIVEVTCEQLKVDSFDGNNGPVLTIDMLNAKLGFVHTTGAPAQQQQGQAQQGFQQVPQPQGGFQQQTAPKGGFQQQGQAQPHYQQAGPDIGDGPAY
mgnify:FL=1